MIRSTADDLLELPVSKTSCLTEEVLKYENAELPEPFDKLHLLFRHLEQICSLNFTRGKESVFEKVSSNIRSNSGKHFSIDTMRQICYLYPDAYHVQIRKEKKDGKEVYDYTLKPNLRDDLVGYYYQTPVSSPRKIPLMSPVKLLTSPMKRSVDYIHRSPSKSPMKTVMRESNLDFGRKFEAWRKTCRILIFKYKIWEFIRQEQEKWTPSVEELTVPMINFPDLPKPKTQRPIRDYLSAVPQTPIEQTVQKIVEELRSPSKTPTKSPLKRPQNISPSRPFVKRNLFEEFCRREEKIQMNVSVKTEETENQVADQIKETKKSTKINVEVATKQTVLETRRLRSAAKKAEKPAVCRKMLPKKVPEPKMAPKVPVPEEKPSTSVKQEATAEATTPGRLKAPSKTVGKPPKLHQSSLEAYRTPPPGCRLIAPSPPTVRRTPVTPADPKTPKTEQPKPSETPKTTEISVSEKKMSVLEKVKAKQKAREEAQQHFDPTVERRLSLCEELLKRGLFLLQSAYQRKTSMERSELHRLMNISYRISQKDFDGITQLLSEVAPQYFTITRVGTQIYMKLTQKDPNKLAPIIEAEVQRIRCPK